MELAKEIPECTGVHIIKKITVAGLRKSSVLKSDTNFKMVEKRH